MRFDEPEVYAIIQAKMIFRPSIVERYRAGLAGLLCLTSVCISNAGDSQGQPSDAAPAHVTINKNVNAPVSEPGKSLDDAVPNWSQPNDTLNSSQDALPPYRPPVARPLTQREQEWLDRRKNWVFMTPEELMSETDADKMLGIKDYKESGEPKKPTSALERYYQHLLDADHTSTTNKTKNSRDWVSESWDNETNSTAGAGEKANDYYAPHFFDNPFNQRSDQGSQRPRPDAFSDVFDLNTDTTTRSDNVDREKKELEAHMEAFKQLWDIDQPAPLALPSHSASSSAGSGGALATAQPTLGTASLPTSGASAQPPQNTLTTERNSGTSMLMMHPSFTAPQRRF